MRYYRVCLDTHAGSATVRYLVATVSTFSLASVLQQVAMSDDFDDRKQSAAKSLEANLVVLVDGQLVDRHTADSLLTRSFVAIMKLTTSDGKSPVVAKVFSNASLAVLCACKPGEVEKLRNDAH